jgi:hypothetical protein
LKELSNKLLRNKELLYLFLGFWREQSSQKTFIQDHYLMGGGYYPLIPVKHLAGRLEIKQDSRFIKLVNYK